MTRYAEGTSVPVDRTMAEIRRTLTRFKAEEFVYGERPDTIMVGFVIKGVQMRLQVPLPDPDDIGFTLTPTGKQRVAEAATKAHEDEVKRRWRSLANFIKATLDAVESGIITLEEGFLAHMVLPNGRTVGQEAIPELQHMLASGKLPPALISGGE